MLRPIRDDIDLTNAQEVLDLLAVMAKLTKDRQDYLDSLATLVHTYEQSQATPNDDLDPLATLVHTYEQSQATPNDDLDPLAALRYLLESHDMSGSDLGRLLGNHELGPALLRGSRQLSKAHMVKLARHFKVSTDLFLRRGE